jgi:nucleotide-binding universal stress UspA family protein
MNTIVVGYDGSEAAERALTEATNLAEAQSARLVVVSVSPVPTVAAPAPVPERAAPVLLPGTVAGPVATGGTAPLSELERERTPEAQDVAKHTLERAREILARRQLEVEYVAEVGAAADRLLEVAEERQADLIVVGSREHGFVERLFGNPVDETVARRSGRNVLLVH